VVALLAALLLVWAAAAAAAPTVILLSLDGVRHDDLSRGALPAFARMARQGARAEALVPVFPSLTFPSHVSLATGARPDRHGIVANAFLDPVRGVFDMGADASFLEAEPIWVTAERQGVHAATFFWVGSETDWHGVGATYRVRPFDTKVTEKQKVAQILAWLDLPEAKRPHLILSWWHGADHVGHLYGPDSKAILRALQGQDEALGSLLAGLDARGAWGETTLLVVSDHGMAALTQEVDVRAALKQAGIRARVFTSDALANVYLADPAQAPAVAALLARIPGVRAYPRDAVPEALHYRSPRVGDVVAFVDPPLSLRGGRQRTGAAGALRRLFRRTIGGHGYDPARFPDMDGILLALGRDVPAGAVLPAVPEIDVAPTVARLLGIRPPAQCQGRPIPALSGASPDGAPAR
jgi:predicted AlkP superfamily pyrophosphatase or phosphodiesterase